MKVVLQRVSEAKVSVDGVVMNEINQGYVLLIGFCHEDTVSVVEKVATKIMGLRLFPDQSGKMNDALTTNQTILAISQFTLYANISKGKRPSFSQSMAAAEAEVLYDYFCTYCQSQGREVKKGVFGAYMDIALVNEGPITIIIDSKEL